MYEVKRVLLFLACLTTLAATGLSPAATPKPTPAPCTSNCGPPAMCYVRVYHSFDGNGCHFHMELRPCDMPAPPAPIGC